MKPILPLPLEAKIFVVISMRVMTKTVKRLPPNFNIENLVNTQMKRCFATL